MSGMAASLRVASPALRAGLMACLVAGLLAAVPAPVSALALCELRYDALPAPVGSTVPAHGNLLSFAPAQALASGDVLRITFPAGTTFAQALAASDFRIRQVDAPAASGCTSASGTPGTATAPSALALAPAQAAGVACSVPPSSGSGCPTVDLTVAAGSLLTGTDAGLGKIVVSMSATGGGKIRHPPTQETAAAAQALAVETRRSGATRDSLVTSTGVDFTFGAEWAQFHQNSRRTGVAPLTDVQNTDVVLGTQQNYGIPGAAPVRSSPIVGDLNGDGTLDMLFSSSVGDAGTRMTLYAYQKAPGTPGGPSLLYWRYEIPFAGCLGVPQATTIDGWVNVAVADMDGDGNPEVIVAADYVTDVQDPIECHDAKIFVLDGQPNGAFPASTNLVSTVWGAGGSGPCSGMTSIASQVYPAVGDIDGYPGLEAVAAYTHQEVNAPTRSHVTVVRWDPASAAYTCRDAALVQPACPGPCLPADPFMVSSPVLAELRPSRPGLELLLGIDDGDTAGRVFLCEPTRTSIDSGGIAGCESRAMCSGVRGLAVEDMDADGSPDVVATGRRAQSTNSGCAADTGSLSILDGGDVATNMATAARADATGAGFPGYGAAGGAAGTAATFQWNAPVVAPVGSGNPQALTAVHDEYGPTSPAFNTGQVGNIDTRGYDGSVTCPGSSCRWAIGGPPPTDFRSRVGGLAVDMIIGSDKRPEYLSATRAGSLSIYPFQASGAFSAPTALASVTTGLLAPMAAADVDGDCQPNVIVGYSAGSVVVFGDGHINNGGPFPVFEASAAPGRPEAIGGLRINPSGDPAYASYFRIDNPPAGVSTSDTLYAGGFDRVSPGALRLTARPTPNPYPAGTTVFGPDADVGATYSTAVAILRIDLVPAGLGAEDALYADNDGDGKVSSGDFRFTPYPAVPPFGAGTTVAATDEDAGRASEPTVRLDISWDAPSGSGAPLTAYKVYRGTAPGLLPSPATLLATITARTLPSEPYPAAYQAPVTMYTDLGVAKNPPGTLYYYRIQAVNCIGEGPGPTFLGDTRLPRPVTDLRAVPDGDPAYPGRPGPTSGPRVRLSWTVPSTPNAQCRWIEGYEIYRTNGTQPMQKVASLHAPAWPRMPPSPGTALSAPLPAPSITWTDTDVSRLPAPGNLYTYRVEAVNCVGRALPAAGDTAVGDVRVPDPPVLATPKPSYGPAYSGELRIQLDWAAPPQVRGCGPTAGPAFSPAYPSTWVEGYRIYRTLWPTPVTATPANLLATVTSVLTPPDPLGWPGAVPPTPKSPLVRFIDNTSLALGQRYNYGIAAVNCVGPGPMALAVGDLRLPQEPTGLTATPDAGGLDRATLAWTLPAGTPSPSNNADCTWLEGYQLERRLMPGAWPGTAPNATFELRPSSVPPWPRTPPSAEPGSPLGTSFVDTTVTHGVYEWRLRAVNCVGASPWTPWVRGTVGENLPPAVAIDADTYLGQAYVAVPAGDWFIFDAASNPLSVSDPDDLPGDLERLEVSVNAGTLRLGSTAGLDFACGPFPGPPAAAACLPGATWSSTHRFRGTLADLGRALTGLTFNGAGVPCNPPEPAATLSVRIHDEGRNGHRGAAGALDASLQVTLFCAQAPAFQSTGDTSSAEDSGLRTVAGWAYGMQYGAGGTPSAIRFTVVNDNPLLFDVAPSVSPAVFAPGLGGGDLTYRPAADACGTATLTVRLEDNGGQTPPPFVRIDRSAPRQARITVHCVNDAPAFKAETGVLDVDHDAGPLAVRIGTLARPAGDGREDELAGPAAPLPWNAPPAAAQRTRWTARALSGALFDVLPAMTPDGLAAPPWPNGTLTFSPALGMSGTTLVEVCLVDDGGTALGGVDTTCVSITVHVNGPPRAMPDCYTAAGRLAVPAPGLLANDQPGNLAPMAAVLQTPPAAALVFALRPDGSFEYEPRPGFTGTDTFLYTVSEGGFASVPVSVCIQVLPGPVAVPPVAAFLVRPDPPVAREDALLLDASIDTDGRVAAWTWETSDGGFGTGPQFTHVFAQAGTYRVNLTVWDDQGLFGAVEREVRVVDGTPVLEPEVPALTPKAPAAPPTPPTQDPAPTPPPRTAASTGAPSPPADPPKEAAREPGAGGLGGGSGAPENAPIPLATDAGATWAIGTSIVAAAILGALLVLLLQRRRRNGG